MVRRVAMISVRRKIRWSSALQRRYVRSVAGYAAGTTFLALHGDFVRISSLSENPARRSAQPGCLGGPSRRPLGTVRSPPQSCSVLVNHGMLMGGCCCSTGNGRRQAHHQPGASLSPRDSCAAPGVGLRLLGSRLCRGFAGDRAAVRSKQQLPQSIP